MRTGGRKNDTNTMRGATYHDLISVDLRRSIGRVADENGEWEESWSDVENLRFQVVSHRIDETGSGTLNGTTDESIRDSNSHKSLGASTNDGSVTVTRRATRFDSEFRFTYYKMNME